MNPGNETPSAAGRPPSGQVERISDAVRVVTAPNAGPMTHTGTRTYVVGNGDVALIDPGPADPRHFDALLGALEPGERIAQILVTHSHLDHSPLARAFAERAPVAAFGRSHDGRSQRMNELERTGFLGGGEGVDREFVPDVFLADGEILEGGNWALQAIHTPGHLSNHMCFALVGAGMLFTGDHVMGWSTTLVSPPDGDISDFMGSLRKLIERPERTYLPGHGPPVGDGPDLAARQLAHRQEREAQIIAALGGGPAAPPALVEKIYEGLDPRLRAAASRNVLAHLIDLAGRGIVRAAGPVRADALFELGADADKTTSRA